MFQQTDIRRKPDPHNGKETCTIHRLQGYLTIATVVYLEETALILVFMAVHTCRMKHPMRIRPSECTITEVLQRNNFADRKIGGTVRHRFIHCKGIKLGSAAIQPFRIESEQRLP